MQEKQSAFKSEELVSHWLSKIKCKIFS